MNNFYTRAISIISFLVMGCVCWQPIYAQEFREISTLEIGQSIQSVLHELAEPYDTIRQDEYVLYRFNSSAPSFADFLYSTDGNIVLISDSKHGEELMLQSYIDQLGDPDVSIFLYDESLADSLKQRIHIWASEGKAVITSGSALDSPVLREDTFTPMSLDEYWESWGSTYVGNEEVEIRESLLASREIENGEVVEIEDTIEKERSTNLRNVLIVIGIVLSGIGGVVWWRKGR